MLLVIDNLDVCAIPEGSLERREFVIGIEAEIARLLGMHIDNVEVRQIHRKGKKKVGANVYICLHYPKPSESRDSGVSGRAGDSAFRELLLENKYQLMNNDMLELRHSAGTLCDELLNLLVKLSGGTRDSLANLNSEDSGLLVKKKTRDG